MFLFLGKSKDVVTPLIEKIKEYVKRNPVKASVVIRFWLKSEEDKQLNEANIMKAANVLLSLGENITALLFAELNKEDIHALNKGMKALSKTLANQQLDALLEFYELCKTLNPFHLTDYQQFMRKLLDNSIYKASQQLNNTSQESLHTSDELEQLNAIDTRALANSMSKEHPQTIAVILAHIESDKRAKVLALLPPEIQSDVCVRIARLDSVNPDILRELKVTLMKEMKELHLSDYDETLGVPLLAEIFNNIDQFHEEQILEGLDEIDPVLAEDIRNQMFTFEDLVCIDDIGTQTLLKEIDKQVLVLALKSANEDVKKKFFANISQRAVDMILDDIEALGTVKLSDVNDAQATIVDIALKLEAEGRIAITKLDIGDALV